MEEKFKDFLEILNTEIKQTEHKFKITGIFDFNQKVETLCSIKQIFENCLKDKTANNKDFAIFIRKFLRSLSDNNKCNINIDNNEKLWLISEIINLNIPLKMQDEREEKKTSENVNKLIEMLNSEE